jgi:2-methylisocitrate lyase-like PEP mutase family enzyme
MKMDEQRLVKFERFKALHQGEGAFVTPNPWDAGTVRIFTAMGLQGRNYSVLNYRMQV